MDLVPNASASGMPCERSSLDKMVALTTLRPGARGVIAAVSGGPGTRSLADALARLGFRAGRAVRVVATGPFGRSPWAVEVGSRVFALRSHEAAMLWLCA